MVTLHYITITTLRGVMDMLTCLTWGKSLNLAATFLDNHYHRSVRQKTVIFLFS